MNEEPAFCPHCRQEVVFAITGKTKRCPECGHTYRMGRRLYGRGRSRRHDGESESDSSLKFLVIAIVVICGWIMVVIGVLFAGCLAMTRIH